jgi:hypothetical protein
MTMSGRFKVGGTGFGLPSDASHVLVGGIVAPFTRWTATAITAYVPEGAALGTDPVQVVTAGGSSNTVTLDVTARQLHGRLAWRFEMDSMYAQARPAVGPDGTVYEVDIDGHLYALTPDGGLKWIFNGAGPKGVSVGTDGTIYTGDEAAITATNPDGSLKWRYVENPRAFILLGPTVGPDGNIYAVATEGLGVFSLTPAGSLRWATPEAYDRAIIDYQELTFGPAGSSQQLYFHANHHFRAVKLDGSPGFIVDGDGSQPSVAPDGTVATHTWTIGAGGVLYGYNPTTGTPTWSFLVSPNNVSTAPDVDRNGVTYVGWNLASMYALNQNGSQKWKFIEPVGGILQDPIANPAGTLVLTGGQPNYGMAGYFEAVNAANGTFAWKQNLGKDGASRRPIVPFSRIRFAPDGSQAYGSAIISGVYDRSFLYGMSTA